MERMRAISRILAAALLPPKKHSKKLTKLDFERMEAARQKRERKSKKKA